MDFEVPKWCLKQETTITNPSLHQAHQDDDFTNLTMLCFSSSSSSSAASSNSRNSGSSVGFGQGGCFTPSQWMELEHQALIFKYLTANVPIPSYLLNPITRAFHSLPFPSFRSTSSFGGGGGGWGGGGAFHMGLCNSDPEPGRCRRTDGKKWRCSRDAVADQKYCERHINRGRHRSRKPVEPSSTTTTTTTTTPAAAGGGVSATGASTLTRNKEIATGAYQHTTTVLSMMLSPKPDVKTSHTGYFDDPTRPEFGLVCSDSLLNPLIKSSSLANYRPNYTNDNNKPTTQLSISIPTTSTSSDTHHSYELEMGLGLGTQHTRQSTNWVPISWEPSIGGPLAEALHTTSNECKPLNLIDSWDNHGYGYGHNFGSQMGPSLSPTGVLQRSAFGSLSNSSAGSSPRAETNKYWPAI